MKVKDLINCYRGNCDIVFRTEEGFDICQTNISSEGVEPYLEREVTQWIIFSSGYADLGIYLKDVRKS